MNSKYDINNEEIFDDMEEFVFIYNSNNGVNNMYIKNVVKENNLFNILYTFLTFLEHCSFSPEVISDIELAISEVERKRFDDVF